uniref:E3 ubiquitin-protein ligase RMA n=1 Tax=Arundo donax TaxID=35708 RepID=A0A0A9DN07_ARUDO
MIHGGSGGGGGRWRGDRPRGRPPPQPHYRYRPVDAAHRHSPPSSGPALSEQAASSTSTRIHRQQITHPTSTTDNKSSASGTTAAPASTKEPDDKASRNTANFECNVCFDMAAEPVVTKCGHLFCWECLYQWLHVHSRHRECPVCKGQVAEDAIIPIYGRGGSAASLDNMPPRPTGARVESSRQQQHQLHTSPHPMVYLDDDEEEEDPFDFQSMVNFGFGATSLRDAVMSFVAPNYDDVNMDDQYDNYSYEYDPDDSDEVYDYHLMGFPVFSSTGAGIEAVNPSSSQAHADLINLTDNIVGTATGVYHHQEFGYFGANSHNRGRHGRRHRARARSSANHSSTDGMLVGGSGAFYHDNGASSNVSAGASSRPNGGWAERRGRSSRNSNLAGGRGMQDSRRQRTNYN